MAMFSDDMVPSLPFGRWDSGCMVVETQGSHEEVVRRAGCEEGVEA